MIKGNRTAPLFPKWRFRTGRPLALGYLMVLLCLLVGGCTDSDPVSFPIADSPLLGLEQDLRIDGYEAELLPIDWMRVAGDGTIAVLQRQIKGVRFFDPSGNSLGVVGREGEGPGELRSPSQAGWIGDTLWVSDRMLKRITLISTEPAFVRTLPPFMGARPAPEDEAGLPTVSMYSPIALYPGGRLLVSAVGGEVFEGMGLFHVSGDGIVERLVREIPWDPEEGIVRFSDGSVTFYSSVPFYPRSAYTVAPDGSRIGMLTTATSGPEVRTFRVSIYDAFGGEIFSRAYPYQGIPISDEAVDSVLAPRDPGPVPPGMPMTSPERPRGLERALRSRVPPFYPPAYEILLGSDGRAWIRLYNGDGRREWLILDAEGNPEGRVILPDRTRLHVANETHIWTLESDELDVESIVRYRLTEQD